MVHSVRFNYEVLRRDVEKHIPIIDLPKKFKEVLGLRISRPTAYAWFARGSIPLDRLAQLLTVVRVVSGRRLDMWKYYEVRRHRAAA